MDCKNCVCTLNNKLYNEREDILTVEFLPRALSERIILCSRPTSMNNITNPPEVSPSYNNTSSDCSRLVFSDNSQIDIDVNNPSNGTTTK